MIKRRLRAALSLRTRSLITSVAVLVSTLVAPAITPAAAAPAGFSTWAIPTYVESFQVFARGGRGGHSLIPAPSLIVDLDGQGEGANGCEITATYLRGSNTTVSWFLGGNGVNGVLKGGKTAGGVGVGGRDGGQGGSWLAASNLGWSGGGGGGATGVFLGTDLSTDAPVIIAGGGGGAHALIGSGGSCVDGTGAARNGLSFNTMGGGYGNAGAAVATASPWYRAGGTAGSSNSGSVGFAGIASGPTTPDTGPSGYPISYLPGTTRYGKGGDGGDQVYNLPDTPYGGGGAGGGGWAGGGGGAGAVSTGSGGAGAGGSNLVTGVAGAGYATPKYVFRVNKSSGATVTDRALGEGVGYGNFNAAVSINTVKFFVGEAMTIGTQSAPVALSSAAPGYPYSATMVAKFGSRSISTASDVGNTAVTGAGAFTIASGSLPTGLTLNAATGVISGTPDASLPVDAVYTVKVRAGMPSASGIQASSFSWYSIRIADPSLIPTVRGVAGTSQYGIAPASGTYTVSGLAANDWFTTITCKPQVSNFNLLTASTVWYDLTATSPPGDYTSASSPYFNRCTGGNTGLGQSVFYFNGNYTITKAPVTVRPKSWTAAFGTAVSGPIGANAMEILSGRLYNNDWSSGWPARITSIPAGYPAGNSTIPNTTYGSLTAEPSLCLGGQVTCYTASSRYSVTVQPGSWTVTPAAALTVTASSAEYNVGEAAPTITQTTTGWVTIDATSRWTTTRTFGAVTAEGYRTYTYAAPTCRAYTSSSDTVGFVPSDTTAAGSYITRCSGADMAGNYAGINYVDGTLVVKAVGIPVAASSVTMTYGDTLPELTYIGGSGITGITCKAYSGSTEVADLVPAGTYIIRCTGPADDGGTPIIYSDATLTVSKLALTITADALSKQYGDLVTFAGTEFSVTGTLVAEDEVTSVTLTSGGASQSAPYLVAGYPINVSAAVGTGLGNYTITYVNATLSITKPKLTITARDYTFSEGATPDLPLKFDVTGFVNGESFGTSGYQAPMCVAVDGSPVTLDETTVAGTYTIECSGAIAGNYDIDYVDGELNVVAEPTTITVTVTGSSVYGQSPTLTPTLPAGVTIPDLVCALYVGEALFDGTPQVGTTYTVHCEGPSSIDVGGGAVDVLYFDGTWAVTPASLTITATDVTKDFGNSVTLASYTTSGLVAGDTVTAATLSSQGSTALAAVGTYDITVSGATGTGLSNYAITYVKGTLTVEKASTITVIPQDYTFRAGSQPTLPLVVDYQGFASGDSFASEGYVAPVCVVKDGNGDTVTVSSTLAWGEYTISCSGGTAPNYDTIDTSATAKLRVAPASVTITAATGASVYGSAPTVTYSASPSEAALTTADAVTEEFFAALTCSAKNSGSEVTATTSVGTYTSECSGDSTISVYGEDVPVTYVNGTWVVTKAQLTLTVAGISKVYGSTHAFIEADWQLEGLQNDEAMTVTLTSDGAGALASVGEYAISASVTGETLDNYTLTLSVGDLTVTRATIVITAKNKSVKFGATAPASYGYDATDFRNGEGESDPSKARGYVPPTCTSSYSNTTPIGTQVDITCTGGQADDYEFDYQLGALTVQNSETQVQNTSTNLALAENGIATVNLTAVIDTPIAGCLVTFTLVPMLPDGTSEDEYIVSGYTDPQFVSVLIELPVGVYYVKVSLSGNCAGTSDESGVLTVAPLNIDPDMGTTGGGWYSVPGSSRINFGYVVQIVRQTVDKVTGDKTSVYRGEMLWTAKNRWRLKAHIESTLVQSRTGSVISGTASWGTSTCPKGVYVNGASPKCGSFVGTGMLQQWVEDGFGGGGWVNYTPVKFTTTVYDGRWLTTCKNKVCQTTDLSDYFGIKMTPRDGSFLPASVPVTIPIQIRQGQIRIF